MRLEFGLSDRFSTGAFKVFANLLGKIDCSKQTDARKPVVVGHDLYPAVAENLKGGFLDATLYQNQAKQARDSNTYLVDYLNGLRDAAHCTELIVPQLLLRAHIEYAPELLYQ